MREQAEERRNQQANGAATPSYISPSSKGPAHVPEEHKDFISRVMYVPLMIIFIDVLKGVGVSRLETFHCMPLVNILNLLIKQHVSSSSTARRSMASSPTLRRRWSWSHVPGKQKYPTFFVFVADSFATVLHP